jgi:glycosyltransferase involved in cell wall biosynthesis
MSSYNSLEISIIIPFLNNIELLKSCLYALSNQTYPSEKCEIIVVDNGSIESLDSIQNDFPNVLLVQEIKSGSYCARNKGITIAQGNIIAFTDSDCIPSFDWLEQGINDLLSHRNCGIIAGKIQIFFQDPSKPTLIELYEKVSAFPQEKYVRERQFGVTANLFTFKSVIEDVGKFNDTLKSGGDREWGRRAANYGYQVFYADKVCVKHPSRKTWQQLHTKIIRQTSGLLDIISLEENQRKLDDLINWLAYVLPSPRIIKLIIKDPEISGVFVKIQVIGIMLLVKLTRLYESIVLFFKLKNKSYR